MPRHDNKTQDTGPRARIPVRRRGESHQPTTRERAAQSQSPPQSPQQRPALADDFERPVSDEEYQQYLNETAGQLLKVLAADAARRRRIKRGTEDHETLYPLTATTLTPTVIGRLVYALKLGAYIETAAAYAGIQQKTFHRWLKRGAQGVDEAYSLFHRMVTYAMAESELRDLSIIQAASALGAWQASAWRLERKYPHKWALRKQVEVTGKGGGPVQHAHTVQVYLPDNARGSVIEAVAQVVDDDEDDEGEGSVAEMRALVEGL